MNTSEMFTEIDDDAIFDNERTLRLEASLELLKKIRHELLYSNDTFEQFNQWLLEEIMNFEGEHGILATFTANAAHV